LDLIYKAGTNNTIFMPQFMPVAWS